jgi:hypothetical protein
MTTPEKDIVAVFRRHTDIVTAPALGLIRSHWVPLVVGATLGLFLGLSALGELTVDALGKTDASSAAAAVPAQQLAVTNAAAAVHE